MDEVRERVCERKRERRREMRDQPPRHGNDWWPVATVTMDGVQQAVMVEMWIVAAIEE